MINKKLKLAVFDCDGTLVDSQHAIIKSMTATFEAHHLESPGSSAIRRIIGLPLERAIGVLMTGSGEQQNQQMAETYKHLFYEHRMAGEIDEPLFPGTREVLVRLAEEDWLLGVATGKAMRGLLATLKPYGLLDYFATLQTADIALGKPDPDMLHRAMAETGVEAVDTFMIGDTTFDIEMACNAGIKGIGVSWGYHAPDELHDAGAHLVIDYFDTLPRVLEELMEKVT